MNDQYTCIDENDNEDMDVGYRMYLLEQLHSDIWDLNVRVSILTQDIEALQDKRLVALKELGVLETYQMYLERGLM